MRTRAGLCVGLLLAAALSGGALPAGEAPIAATDTLQRTLALTFDDLPAVRVRSVKSTRALLDSLALAVQREGIPAVGFVNEKKLVDLGLDEAAGAALLDPWLAAGLELGNHTYSHPWFWNTPVDSMTQNVLDGERVIRALCAKHGRELHWFRHPYLNTGPDLESKAAFEDFLAEHGYRVAPVTFDNDEYVHAQAYDLARERGDRTACDSLAKEYLRYMESIAAHFEELSRATLGREPAQVLLLHANWLNTEHLGGLAALLRARGYRFVSLEEVLEDPAYSLPDTYIGKRGMSWLERWAITRNQDPGVMPEAPQWVREAAGLKK